MNHGIFNLVNRFCLPVWVGLFGLPLSVLGWQTSPLPYGSIVITNLFWSESPWVSNVQYQINGPAVGADIKLFWLPLSHNQYTNHGDINYEYLPAFVAYDIYGSHSYEIRTFDTPYPSIITPGNAVWIPDTNQLVNFPTPFTNWSAFNGQPAVTFLQQTRNSIGNQDINGRAPGSYNNSFGAFSDGWSRQNSWETIEVPTNWSVIDLTEHFTMRISSYSFSYTNYELGRIDGRDYQAFFGFCVLREGGYQIGWSRQSIEKFYPNVGEVGCAYVAPYVMQGTNKVYSDRPWPVQNYKLLEDISSWPTHYP